MRVKCYIQNPFLSSPRPFQKENLSSLPTQSLHGRVMKKQGGFFRAPRASSTVTSELSNVSPSVSRNPIPFLRTLPPFVTRHKVAWRVRIPMTWPPRHLAWITTLLVMSSSFVLSPSVAKSSVSDLNQLAGLPKGLDCGTHIHQRTEQLTFLQRIKVFKEKLIETHFTCEPGQRTCICKFWAAKQTTVATNYRAMKVEVEQILHMVGGVGETSYATNSGIQEKAISMAQPVVDESIAAVCSSLHPKILAVADLGCSSGPTAFMVIDNITKAASDVCRQLTPRPPEILFFLNDLPGNDFNTIFKSLTEHGKKVREDGGDGSLPCYVVGAPGSFYGRLFPRESIHFVHSSYSVHWLSQVPRGLETKGGVSINKGSIYITRTSPPGVCEAYLEQFQRDFSTFLRLRAEEVNSGGQMVLTFLGRKSDDPLKGEMTYLLELVAEALNSMVAEGHLEKWRLDEFDIPFYGPCLEEVREIVASEGSFDLRRVQTFELDWDPHHDNCDGDSVPNSKQSGENNARCVRAALEPMLASQFGEGVIDTVFARYAENVTRHLSHQKTKLTNFTIALERRG